MNADAFRYLYNYHFAENRRMWDNYILPLTYGQFTQNVDYSRGSVRDQIIHLMDADELWFSELRNVVPLEPPPPTNFDDREIIRARWDDIERNMHDYLAKLQDAMLFDRPIKEPEEDQVLVLWQVLLHVVNHGTDHRAQLLRQLHDLGVNTTSQDFIFYIYDNL
jgi:uncharacterized damage-inducible protein DinB